jgi:hypothetical protein
VGFINVFVDNDVVVSDVETVSIALVFSVVAEVFPIVSCDDAFSQGTRVHPDSTRAPHVMTMQAKLLFMMKC